jgi:hypothetical protein
MMSVLKKAWVLYNLEWRSVEGLQIRDVAFLLSADRIKIILQEDGVLYDLLVLGISVFVSKWPD